MRGKKILPGNGHYMRGRISCLKGTCPSKQMMPAYEKPMLSSLPIRAHLSSIAIQQVPKIVIAFKLKNGTAHFPGLPIQISVKGCTDSLGVFLCPVLLNKGLVCKMAKKYILKSLHKPLKA